MIPPAVSDNSVIRVRTTRN